MIDLSTLNSMVELASGVVVFVAGLLGGLWAFTRYVLERSIIPPVQFDATCATVGHQRENTVLEILLHLKNTGSSALVASNVRADILFLDEEDELILCNDPTRATFAHLRFRHSLRDELLSWSTAPDAHAGRDDAGDAHKPRHQPGVERGIEIVGHHTFVQPGVDQTYTLVTIVPATTSFVLVWGCFSYAQKPTALQNAILSLSRGLGLIQYSLRHVTEAHTVERVFRVAAPHPKPRHPLPTAEL